MSKNEKRWRRFYLILMIFFYGVFIPAFIVDWLFLDGGLPTTAVVVGLALPVIRKSHVNQIRTPRL